MKLKRILSLILAATLAVSTLFTLASCSGGAKKYTVGVVQLIQHPALDSATQGFKDALIEELGADNVSFIEHNGQGKPELCVSSVTDLTTKQVDLILANATAALQAAANGTTTIPVLGTSITDYKSALELDDYTGTIGGNVSGTTDLAPLDQQAAMIKDLYPEANQVGLLYCSAEPNSKYQVDVIKAELEKLGMTTAEFSFADLGTLSTVAQAAAASCDVLYVPTDNVAANGAGVIKNAVGDTPIIAGEENICSGCGVATLSISYYDLGVATGKMAAKILKGEANVSEMAVQYAATFTKKYNAERCAELGIDVAALEAKGYVAIEAAK